MADDLYYRGELSTEVIRWVEDLRDRYPYAVEVSLLPNHSEIQEIFQDRTWVQEGENCMGQKVRQTHRGVPIARCPREVGEPNGTFLFFEDSSAKARFVAAFGEFVRDADPFTPPERRVLVGDLTVDLSVIPGAWFLDSLRHEHSRIVYRGERHEPRRWVAALQHTRGGRRTEAEGSTPREAVEAAVARVKEETAQ